MRRDTWAVDLISLNLRPQASEVARLIPDNETLWVQGPSDMAGKSASLFFYLGRPVRAFRR